MGHRHRFPVKRRLLFPVRPDVDVPVFSAALGAYDHFGEPISEFPGFRCIVVRVGVQWMTKLSA